MSLFFTIGHSTRSLDEFVALLQEASVRRVVDVRSIPWSRKNPQYNHDQLPESLAGFQIGYAHIPALGGRRNRAHEVSDMVNGYWRVAGFHNYADYALTPEFSEGLAQLRKIGAQERCAYMCAEAVWWRCHRRIITDWLIAAGDEVCHILGPDHIDPASLTHAAVVDDNGRVTYPPAPDEAPN